MKKVLQLFIVAALLFAAPFTSSLSAQKTDLDKKVEAAEKARDDAQKAYEAEKAKADNDPKYHDPKLGELKKALDKANAELKPLQAEKDKKAAEKTLKDAEDAFNKAQKAYNDAQKAYNDAVAARDKAKGKDKKAKNDDVDRKKAILDLAEEARNKAKKAVDDAKKALEKAEALEDLAKKEKAVFDAEKALEDAKATGDEDNIKKAQEELDIQKKILENARKKAKDNGHIQGMIAPGSKSYYVSLSGGYLFPQTPGDGIFGNDIMARLGENIYSNPTLFEQIYQSLGGEFLIGNTSGAFQTGPVAMSNNAQWGLGAGRYMGRHCLVSVSYQQRSHTFSATFPVMVIAHGGPNAQPSTRQVAGTLTAPVQFRSVGIQNTWLIGRNQLQPYAGAGLSWQWMQQGDATAAVGGVEVPLPNTAVRDQNGQAVLITGLQFNVSPQWFIALEGQLVRGFSDNPVGGTGIGLRVGVDLGR